MPEKSHGQRDLVGYSLWSCKRVGHNLVKKQQLHVSTKIIYNHRMLQRPDARNTFILKNSELKLIEQVFIRPSRRKVVSRLAKARKHEII